MFVDVERRGSALNGELLIVQAEFLAGAPVGPHDIAVVAVAVGDEQNDVLRFRLVGVRGPNRDGERENGAREHAANNSFIHLKNLLKVDISRRAARNSRVTLFH